MSLPSGYTRLEYIESTGTQYIDTGFKPNQDTRVVMDVDPKDNGVDDWFFDGRHAANNNSFGVYCQYGISAKSWYSDYGTNRLQITGPSSTGRRIIDKNKNVTTVAGYTVTHSAQTFQSDYNLYLLCLNSANTRKGYVSGKLYSCRIYDDRTLVRDFIPCKNASGVIGLWDDANSAFYTNAGTGSFTAGPEVSEAHKVLIDGTLYSVQGGSRCLVGGTGYDVKKGRALIDGSGVDITLPGDQTPLSDLPVGSIIYGKIDGKATALRIVHKGLPDSIYDASCNGIWVMTEDVFALGKMVASGTSYYYPGDVGDTYLNTTFIGKFSSELLAAVKTVKIPYIARDELGFAVSYSGANGLQRQAFFLSIIEVGFAMGDMKVVDGVTLSYFTGKGNTDRIARYNGNDVSWWSRTIDYNKWRYVSKSGEEMGSGGTFGYGYRPAFILYPDTIADADMNIITA